MCCKSHGQRLILFIAFALYILHFLEAKYVNIDYWVMRIYLIGRINRDLLLLSCNILVVADLALIHWSWPIYFFLLINDFRLVTEAQIDVSEDSWDHVLLWSFFHQDLMHGHLLNSILIAGGARHRDQIVILLIGFL